jgi:Fur family transcriptional regulator, ferric uptake regulator
MQRHRGLRISRSLKVYPILKDSLLIFGMVEKNNTQNEARALYAEWLKRKSMFFTKERALLLDFIMAQPGHFSADELLFELQKIQAKVSRATVYRSLNQMVEAGLLTESDFGHGHTHYEVSLGERPHVHFIFTDTGVVKEMHSQKIEDALNEMARKEGFSIKRYKIQVFGENRKAR